MLESSTMPLFPDCSYADATDYCEDYFARLARATASVDRQAVTRAATLIETAITAGARIFAFGNGGSAAIANHLTCDFMKGIATGTGLRPKVQSLAEPVALMTAISNDIAYEDVFIHQLQALAEPGDLAIAISSSGNSPNIIKALGWARHAGLSSIAMTGFTGGEASALADVGLHVDAANYGLVEDVHQSLMHLLAQYVRQRRQTDPAVLGQVKF